MSNKPGRKLRRLAESYTGRQIAVEALNEWIWMSFRRLPKWLPKFAWRFLLSLVIKTPNELVDRRAAAGGCYEPDSVSPDQGVWL